MTDNIAHGLSIKYSGEKNAVYAARIGFSVDTDSSGYYYDNVTDDFNEFVKLLPASLFKIKTMVYDPNCYTSERLVERELSIQEMFDYLNENQESEQFETFTKHLVNKYHECIEWDEVL
jgi:hypothetical protein